MTFRETEELTSLIDEVKKGWNAVIVDHVHWNETRTDVTVSEVLSDRLILTSQKGWLSQGRGYHSVHFMRIGDPEIDGEREIDRDRKARGNRVSVHRAPWPNAGSPRLLLMTFIFTPPDH